VLAGGVYWLEAKQNQRQQDFENQRAMQQEKFENERAQARTLDAALQAYFDTLGQLLLTEDLLNSQESDEVRLLARARTLALLPTLDPTRKKLLLQFLYQSDLIQKDRPVVNLVGANLKEADLRDANLVEANLCGADLREANLEKTNLPKADLRGVYLRGANLSGATLEDADLLGAYLSGANLRGVNLDKADLRSAHLEDADLKKADLWEADLSNAKLQGTKNLTQNQIEQAVGNEWTELPDSLQLPEAWTKSTGKEPGS